MKLKSSIFALAALAGLGSQASAITIDIVGSTAGRSAVYSKILALVDETATTGSGTTLSGSNQAIIHGTYSGTPVVIRLNFTGSAAGVNQVTNQVPVQFYKETMYTSGFNVGVAYDGANNTETSAPEFGYSDVFQSTTAFKTPLLTVEDEVAIIPFKFFKHSNANASLTNVTSQALRYLYGSSGSAPLSLFTGVPGDAVKNVYATGRDASSGTRITTFAEINTSQIAVSQYQPATSATNGTGSVTSLGGTSASGFGSGSNVTNVLNSTFGDGTATNPSSIIGYVGASDWPQQLPDNAIELTFNGVPYSADALAEGRYTFWGYLHQFHKGLTGTNLSFYNAVRNAITTAPGSGLEAISIMHVDRGGDGFPVVPILE